MADADPLARWLEIHRHWPYVSMEWESLLVPWPERKEPHSVCWVHRGLLIERQSTPNAWRLHVVRHADVRLPLPLRNDAPRDLVDPEWRPTVMQLEAAQRYCRVVALEIAATPQWPKFEWTWHHDLWVARLDVARTLPNGSVQFFPGVQISRLTAEAMVDALFTALAARRETERYTLDMRKRLAEVP